MMKTLKFVIFGRPIPWARARSHGKMYFTAPKQANAKKEIAEIAKAAANGMFFDKAVQLSCKFRYERPKSDKKKLRDYVDGRPDLDNLMKLVKDALSKVIWTDDSLVVKFGESDKRFTDGRAHTLVEITELEQ